MIDRHLRPLKRRALAPISAALKGLNPAILTLLGLIVGLGAALAAAAGAFAAALGLWWLSRLLDGLDGEVARLQHPGGSPRGGYLDLMADLVVYSALPIAIAGALGGEGSLQLGGLHLGLWPIVALLLASFYLNLGSWALLGPLLDPPRSEDRGRDAPSVRLPSGLIEGAETLILFSVALAFPQAAPATLALFALLTLLGALQRTLWGLRTLRGAA